jgi:hypothetical protein
LLAAVSEFVEAKASSFNKFQQAGGEGRKRFSQKASEFRALPHVSTTRFHLIRDQEAGGSNPLAPTFIVSKIQPVSETKPKRAADRNEDAGSSKNNTTIGLF